MIGDAFVSESDVSHICHCEEFDEVSQIISGTVLKFFTIETPKAADTSQKFHVLVRQCARLVACDRNIQSVKCMQTDSLFELQSKTFCFKKFDHPQTKACYKICEVTEKRKKFFYEG